MLASTFLKFGTVKLETAGGGAAGNADVSKIALIHVGAEARLRIAGAPVLPEAVAEELERLRAGGKTDAILVLRKEATATDLISALTRVRQHNFDSVRVVD